MGYLWCVGQAGITVEAAGALLGVWYAWETRARWRAATSPTTYATLGENIDRPREEFIGQFPKQLAAFGLLAVGLVLQFVGNFAK